LDAGENRNDYTRPESLSLKGTAERLRDMAASVPAADFITIFPWIIQEDCSFFINLGKTVTESMFSSGRSPEKEKTLASRFPGPWYSKGLTTVSDLQ
jgi:hypothetical protein